MKKKQKSSDHYEIQRLISFMDFATRLKKAQEERKKKDKDSNK